MAILSELRRRNVFRVAIAYLAGAWLLVQIAETLFPLFDVAESWSRALVIVLAAGLVPAIVISWLFEWTPQGMLRDTGEPAGGGYTPSRSFDRWVAAVLALAVAYFAVDEFLIEPRPPGDRHSIAVLPFANLSSDPEQEYFSDGITEELLNLLARINGLRVISRSTAWTFKGKDVVIPEAAAKMKVAYVLEGSVRKAGETVRITAQLIEGATDTHVWSETYDRSLADIFAVQDEIAAQVVRELKIRILGGPPSAEELDPEAQDLWMKTRYIMDETNQSAIGEAKRLIERVLELEPNFVPAIWQYARILAVMTGDVGSESAEVGPRIRELVARMEELDPASTYTTAWQAFIARNWDDDLQRAAEYLERGSSSPTLNIPRPYLSQFLGTLADTGRVAEAVAVGRYYAELDPACQRCIEEYAYMLRLAGRHRQAAEELEKLLDWRPGTPTLSWHLGVAWLVAGEPEKALAYFDEIDPSFQAVPADVGRAMALYDLGRTAEYEQQLAAVREQSDNQPEALARIYAWTGQNDLAFEWLEKTVERFGASIAVALKNDLYAKLRSDPRWPAFLERNGASDARLEDIEFDPQYAPAVRRAVDKELRRLSNAEPG